MKWTTVKIKGQTAHSDYCKLIIWVHFTGETESFQNSFEDSDISAGAIALSFYSGFWAYSGW